MVLILHFAMMVNKIDRPNTTPTVSGICTFAVYFVLSRFFKLFTTRVSFRATPARALEIRHLSVLSRNRQGLSITFRAQLMAGNRKGSF